MNALFDTQLGQAPSDAGQGTRRLAALQVHALPSKDRHWLLGHLSAEQRADLMPLLHELQELEISSEDAASLLRARSIQSAIAVAKSDPAAKLSAASAQAVWQLLCEEPRFLVDQVLLMQDWPWAAEVRARMSALNPAARGGDGEPSTNPAPALQAALVSRLAERLAGDAIPDGVAAQGAGPWWRQWRRWRRSGATRGRP